MKNKALITKFYTAFAEGNANIMADCYAENITFEDPAFGILEGDKAGEMWRMLLERNKNGIKISYRNVTADENTGSAEWIAEYIYTPNKREVVNHISATFQFENGKIVKHTDHFDLWKWSRQALGLQGWMLGWTSFFKQKLQQRTNKMLEKYIAQKSKSL
ncbi:MAG: nuclear transport factor 2 family protein [Saprospiraceae bacterium]|nr:nuclear transport factor 2 family protein [Saprospiraceae bacterium]